MGTILRYSRSLDRTGEQNYQMICTRVSTFRHVKNRNKFVSWASTYYFLSKLLDIPRKSHTLQDHIIITKYITNTAVVYKLWFHTWEG